MTNARSAWLRLGAWILITALAIAGAPRVISSAGTAHAAVLPSISVSDVTVTEGDGGTVTAVFDVTQDKRGKATVSFQTVQVTADAPADFLAKSGKLQFAGNRLVKHVSVTVNGDTLDEPDETFFLDLTNVKGATIEDGRGVGTILDDDPPPSISIAAAVTVPEGNAGDQSFASLDVTLSEPSGRAVSVAYASSDGTATLADDDYLAASGTLDFAPGDTLQTIVVTVVGDDDLELDETFDVVLSSPVHATLGNDTGVVTIPNNDPAPPGSAILSVDGDSVREGARGTTTVLTFTITRSGELTTAVNVDVLTSNGTASAPEDYVALTDNVAFGANETTVTVDVTVNGDNVLEQPETLFLSLDGPSPGAAIGTGQATGTIRNDDTRTTLSVVKRSARIVAKGRLSPAGPGKRIIVKLFRRRNGAWVLLQTRRPLLSGSSDLNGDGFTDSVYRTRFSRPRPGRCKVTSRFRGTSTLAPSQAVRLLRC